MSLQIPGALTLRGSPLHPLPLASRGKRSVEHFPVWLRPLWAGWCGRLEAAAMGSSPFFFAPSMFLDVGFKRSPSPAPAGDNLLCDLFQLVTWSLGRGTTLSSLCLSSLVGVAPRCGKPVGQLTVPPSVFQLLHTCITGSLRVNS